MVCRIKELLIKMWNKLRLFNSLSEIIQFIHSQQRCLMKQGLYEQIINNLTKKQIAKLDSSKYDIGKEALDPEQTSDDAEAVLAQVKTCNEIITTLKYSLGQEEYEELKLDEQGEVLTYVYSKLNHIRVIKGEWVLRPITPLSQSSLFTGSHAEPNM